MRLENRVCVITGSGRGLGRQLALSFAKEGATVAITYHEQLAEAKDTARLCQSDLVYQLDVRDRLRIRDVFGEIAKRCGRIDILVNNAGINRPADFDLQTDEEWEHVIAVDLKGVFLCSQEVLQFMPARGRIINIGSLSGEYGGPRSPAYAAAKAGVMALTHCLARFVGDREICVNCLSPGVIDSALTSHTMSPEVRATVEAQLLLKRLGQPEDLVGPALLLASEESAYMTGQTISVNGGAWVR
ncbi:MAG: SDR family oxidoreductase [Planctomycetes bacterium]|nr:SDR family oxidoreductase [Planctomycetota bacterium]